MGTQLKAYADLMRWKADTTKKPEDEEGAAKAMNAHEDHVKASKVV